MWPLYLLYVLLALHVSGQMTENVNLTTIPLPIVSDTTTTTEIIHNIDTTTTPPTVTTTEVPSEDRPCVDSRGRNGTCVMRKLCEYGTFAIDRTLYASRSYVRQCTPEKVCCLKDNIVVIKETVSQESSDVDDFSFDDDD